MSFFSNQNKKAKQFLSGKAVTSRTGEDIRKGVGGEYDGNITYVCKWENETC
jgi:hypothetical protein